MSGSSGGFDPLAPAGPAAVPDWLSFFHPLLPDQAAAATPEVPFPGEFPASSAQGGQPDNAMGNVGYGSNPNPTAHDVMSALGSGFGTVFGGPLGLLGLGASAATGKAPGASTTLGFLSGLLGFGGGGSNTGAGGLSSGQIEINPGNTLGGGLSGFGSPADITGGGNSMSGGLAGVEAPDGSKGNESYA